ncbi:hypothetical protein Cs7R123_03130 [Catellatospora sp. TT07R-123]|uniref:hypothetical protein n=1 Tax=Catellatospora sp. TT07R-123 TaxID=2733863 RepID=UPI001B26CD19|nr:hypothetical protein [Catellatospora sp. TT07R-123]GHJ42971.1 hypothetical protein Cs7R123_03130 [Catellatospora sp. TT07R-123]
MRTPLKLGLFGLGLAGVFAASFGVGHLAGPAAPADPREPIAAHAGHDSPSGDVTGSARLPGGLQVAADGYRLRPLTTTLSTRAPRQLRFTVTGPDGRPVTDYTPTHDKALHLILVRRDLTGFQHLHPALGTDGVWSIDAQAPAAGQYRMFADFQPAGRTEPLTLGVDLAAAGDYRPQPLPAAARTAVVDGYTVTLAGDLAAGASATLTLTVARDGVPVRDLQPYLAAYGHLVALRDGDLAYLHVHPDGAPGDGRTAAGPGIVFHAEVPSAGAYRLFLDFRHGGVVHTAAFTAVADASAPTADPGQAGGHR